MACKTAEELIALAKSEEIEITEAEAGAYFAELSECEIKDENPAVVAGFRGTIAWSGLWLFVLIFFDFIRLFS